MSTDQSPRRSDDPQRDTKDTHGDTNLPRRLPVGRGDLRTSDRGRQRRQRHVVPRTADTRRSSRNRRARRATRGNGGRTTSRSSPISASTPTATRSSGLASSRARASSRTRRSRTTRRVTDRCVELGIQPVVTFSHFTAPHWFAMRGSWLDAGRSGRLRPILLPGDGGVRRPHRLRRHAQRAEPRRRCSTGSDFPDFVRDLERATLEAASAAAGVERYRAGNVVLPEEFSAMQAGLTAAHRAAKAAIKSHRDRPPGRPERRHGRRSGGR